MGTSNFYTKNASKTYAICMGYETPLLDEDGNELEETEYTQPDTEEFEDKLACIQEQAKEKLKDIYSSYTSTEGDSERGLFSIEKEKMFGDVYILVTLSALVRSGYYEGACLDYNISINVDGREMDSADDIDLGYSDTCMNKGLQKMLLPKVQSWTQNAVEDLQAKLEAFFTEVSMPLVVVARLSNGETMYAKS